MDRTAVRAKYEVLTTTGLQVRAVVDTRAYPTGVKNARAAGVGPDTVRHGQAKLTALNTPTK